MRSFKRFLSILLVVCMLLTAMPAAALAEEAGEVGGAQSAVEAPETQPSEQPEPSDEPVPSEQPEPSDEPEPEPESGLGEVSLAIKHIISDAGSGFRAALRGEDGALYELAMRENGAGVSFGLYSGLPAGEYELSVTGRRYVPYTQRLSVGEECVAVTLYNDDLVNDGRPNDSLFGVITLGDLDGDGEISDADADALLAHKGGADALYDMNGDGATDLVDLAYIVRNQTGNVEAKPVRTASSLAVLRSAAASVRAGEASVVAEEGEQQSIEQTLFSHGRDSYVSLAPESGGISEQNPVELELNLEAEGGESARIEAEAITIAPPASGGSAITDGYVTIEAVSGGEDVEIGARLAEAKPEINSIYAAHALAAAAQTRAAEPEVSVENDGTIVINIGSKVAIKKVTIRVTGSADGSLADIASVEFLSNFADRVPEPNLSIPEILTASNTNGEYKALTFSWTQQLNVTGYEVSITGPNLSVLRSTSETSYTFQSDSLSGRIDAFRDYTLRVRSVSGDWRSDWSEPYVYTVSTSDLPNRPEQVTATGEIQGISVSWRALWDTESWSVHYKELGSEGGYEVINSLTSPSCRIENLKGGVSYELYVVAHSRNGDSPASDPVSATALTPEGVKLPKFGLINRDSQLRLSSDHIINITGYLDKSYTIYRGDGAAVSHTQATFEDWKAVVDSNPASYLYIDDWDSGVSYDNLRGPLITLDHDYEIGSVRVAPSETTRVNVSYMQIGYKNEKGETVKLDTRFALKYDEDGRRYYEAILREPITTDYIEVRTTTGAGAPKPITIAEVGIYEYDPLLNDAEALFTDETEIELRAGVTQTEIDALRARSDTRDSLTGEYNPCKALVDELLSYAEQLLAESDLDKPVEIDTGVTVLRDGHLGFAQKLSDNQPLGYVAAAGQTVIVYVGSSVEARGSYASLQFTVSQFHPEVNSWSKDILHLRVGRNVIQLPPLSSGQTEHGGSLYIWYGSGYNAKKYTVRVKGAQQIPMLNVDGLEGEARSAAIDSYVTALEEYVPQIASLHEAQHTGGSSHVNFAYDDRNCFLNSTEIVMNDMILSVPASQVLAALEGNHEQKAEQLESAIDAMEQEIELFYQFKGFNRQAEDTDRWPSEKLNIRYHRMFTGAFMYAGSKHIGIEWDSVPGLFKTSPVQTGENGEYISGIYSGWGIAHEIGHVINSAVYQRVEVTNNVFASLAQTDETNATFRGATKEEDGSYSYRDVYKAVAAGNTGHTGNVFTQLAMYWQLHLAYDDGYSYRLYESADEQQDALFYARVDSYLRNPEKADKAVKEKWGVEAALTLDENGDQSFMRACCAAAGKDVLDFFRAWGFTPNEDTVAYAQNFEPEEREIQFIDDDSRLYRIEGGRGMSAGTAVTAKIENAENSRITGSNEVVISLKNSNTEQGAMLGYKICRNGKLVAFVLSGEESYTDVIATENNRAFVYTVTGIDRLLGETETVTLPEVKVCHDGAIDKSGWSGESNLASADDVLVEAGEGGLCEQTYISAVTKAFDGDADSVYTGTVRDGGDADAEIVINLGASEQITALRYTPAGDNAIGEYEIAVSGDAENWIPVKSGTFTGGEAQTVYFNKTLDDGSFDTWMYTYDASFVRLTAKGQKTVSVAELDILGPTNDNVDLVPAGFGRLSEKFVYSEEDLDENGEPYAIPEGAVAFYGSYKGDPSYSVVLLKDQDGKVIEGEQIILAKVTDRGFLGETSEGRWFYWVEDKALEGVKSVQAELYRVMDAQTLAGERLTSTSLHMELPENIPNIRIESRTEEAAFAPNLPEQGVQSAALTLHCALPAALSEDTQRAESSAASEPLTLVPNREKGSVSFALYAGESPVAMHASIAIDEETEGHAVSGSIVWDEYNEAELYVASVYSEGVIDIYVVSRRGTLGSEGAGGSAAVISGELIVEEHAEDEIAIRFISEKVDYVSPIYMAYSRAAEVETDLVFSDCEHEYSEHVTPPTCTEAGFTTLVCGKCGDSYVKEGSEVPALGHSYVDGVCSVCGVSDPQYGGDTGGGTGGGGGGAGGGGGGGGGAGGSQQGETKPDEQSKGEPADETRSPVSAFTDLESGAWYMEAVAYAVENGLMQGESETIFAPSKVTTRAMLVTILWRLDGAAEGYTESFEDVEDGQWYTSAVAWASANGIVGGYSSSVFAPADTVTREQIAAMLCRYAVYKGLDTAPRADVSSFDDAGDVSAWALDSVEWAVALSILNGMGDGTLAPTQGATRAQIAQFIMNYIRFSSSESSD